MAKKIFSSDIYAENPHIIAIEGTVKAIELNEKYLALLKEIGSGSKPVFSGPDPDTSKGIAQMGKELGLVGAALKEYIKQQEELIRKNAQLELSTKGLDDELIRTRKELLQLTNEKKRNAQVTNEQIGAYQKAKNELAQLAQAMLNLAMEGKANTEVAKRMGEQYSKLYEATLAAEKGVGRFQRNVGNYNMENQRYSYSLFQVTQIMREMPNFAQSAQIGIMSLGNNIPMAVAELQRMARSVDENTGKVVGWGKTLKEVAKTIVSFQGLLILGVSLAIAFSKEIVEATEKMFGLDKATKALTGSLSLQQFEMEKGKDAYVKASSEISTYTEKVKLAKEGKMDEKTVIDEYNKSLGKHIGQVGDLLSLEMQLVELGPQYIKNMMLKAAVEATAKEQAEKRLALEMEILKKTESIIELRKSTVAGVTPETSGYAMGRSKYIESELVSLGKLQAELDNTDKTYSKLLNKIMGRMSDSVDYGDWNLGEEGSGGGAKGTGGVEGWKGETDKTVNLYELRLRQAMKRIDDKKQIDELVARTESERLKMKAKSAKEEADIDRELQETLLRIKIGANEKRLELLNNSDFVSFDSIQKITELRAEIEKLKAEIELLNKEAYPDGKKPEKTELKQNVNTAKEIQQSIMAIAKAYDQYADSREKLQQTRLQNQINATKRRQEELRALSAQGVKDAKDNLAMEEKKIAEMERRQEVLQRRQQNRQLMLSALQTYNTKAMSGDKNALQNTIKDLSALMAFASTLPAFLEGTEDTGENGHGVDGKGGFHAILHPKERVLKKEHNMMVGDMTNDELAEVAFKYRTGMIPMIPVNDDTKSNPVIQELRELKQAIKEQEPPKMYWNDTDKAMEYKYKQGERMVTEIHKTTGIFSTR